MSIYDNKWGDRVKVEKVLANGEELFTARFVNEYNEAPLVRTIVIVTGSLATDFEEASAHTVRILCPDGTLSMDILETLSHQEIFAIEERIVELRFGEEV
jgi:hypothetical protein